MRIGKSMGTQGGHRGTGGLTYMVWEVYGHPRGSIIDDERWSLIEVQITKK